MVNRILFLLIAVFWMVMNVWLWRSEFRGRDELGSRIPAAVVWQKILTAPDDSALEITQHGRKIGYCRWRANVGEAVRTGKVGTEEYQPEGMVKHLSGYTIDLEGNLLLPQAASRIRFDVRGDFSADHRWKEMAGRAVIRPQSWAIHTVAAQESLPLTAEDGAAKWERRFSFADLRDPGKILRELGFPLPLGLLGQTGLWPRQKSVSPGWGWEARTDWLKIGHSKVRVYRLHTRLLDRYQAVVIVSRVGEILRAELPNGILLMNDALINL